MIENQFALSQKREAESYLASGIGHDLNNLLTAIMVYAGLISKAQSDPQLQKYVEQIMGSAQHASQLVARLSSPETITDNKPALLLVEDDELVRCSVDAALSMHGYKVLPAATAEDAISISQNYSGEIHIMVTDLNMPAMNGRELARVIYATRPGIRVLFVSGSSEDSLVQELENERQDFFRKPFSPSALARKIEELLNRRSDE